MSTKIVVGVDGSEGSQRAVEWCAQLAKPLDAEVVVVHVIDIPAYGGLTMMYPIPSLSADAIAEVRDHAEREWAAPLEKASVPHRVDVVEGPTVRTLIQIADRENADLVVTGRRGRGAFAEFILGSTSHTLSHQLHRPLVIVP
jgi:nucleotide-binding universal stress UspA family protein